MRKHLVKCFEDEKFTPFPQTSDPVFKSASSTVHLSLYCCRMPECYDSMVCCDICNLWYHFKCAGIICTLYHVSVHHLDGFVPIVNYIAI